ncbi:MAG: glucosaminidase domain-containing protein, partial [Cyclobacteriaceae bacterium]|nr:glucosaminidase domain-containing protein [Cyclobacteriaceae bacterium]
ILNIPIGNKVHKEHNLLLVEYQEVRKASDIMPIESRYVKPLIYEGIEGITRMDTELRKQKFIELLLPAILVTKYEIFKENKRTIDIWGKLKSNMNITPNDSVFMENLFIKYDTKNFAEINQRQQVHPNSIILAQAAIETGWGSSRFFLQGNNAYGIWSFSKLDDRMESLSARGDIKIYLKKYSTVMESVVDYFHTISKSWAFDQFRKRRAETDNAYELIWYLNKYSELRNDYVKKVGEVMIQNQLTKYDTCELDPAYFLKVKY